MKDLGAILSTVVLFSVLASTATAENCATAKETGYEREDLKDILRKAADHFAEIHGTEIDVNFLDRGLCFNRNDIGCEDVPRSFEFLEYGKPEVQEPVMDTEWEPGHEIKSIIRCNVLADGVDMKCGVSADNAKDVAVSIAMERQFSLTADITVSANVAGFSTSHTVGLGMSTTSSETKTVATANKQTAESSFVVEPGNCSMLKITSSPSSLSGSSDFSIPIFGKLSLRFKHKTKVSRGGDRSAHHEWNLPVRYFMELAEDYGYSDGLVMERGRAYYRGKMLLRQTKFESKTEQLPCEDKLPEGYQLVKGLLQRADKDIPEQDVSARVTQSEVPITEAAIEASPLPIPEVENEDEDAGVVWAGLEDFTEIPGLGGKETNLGLPDTDKN